MAAARYSHWLINTCTKIDLSVLEHDYGEHLPAGLRNAVKRGMALIREAIENKQEFSLDLVCAVLNPISAAMREGIRGGCKFDSVDRVVDSIYSRIMSTARKYGFGECGVDIYESKYLNDHVHDLSFKADKEALKIWRDCVSVGERAQFADPRRLNQACDELTRMKSIVDQLDNLARTIHDVHVLPITAAPCSDEERFGQIALMHFRVNVNIKLFVEQANEAKAKVELLIAQEAGIATAASAPGAESMAM